MRKLSLFLFLFYSSFSFSQSLNKAFNYFNSGKYEAAYASINELLKKDPDNPAAEFLLAKMYFMKDNPKYNLDSANKFIMKSAEGLKKSFGEKDSLKMLSAGWREYTVKELQGQVNAEAYRIAESIKTSDAWNYFIATYVTYPSMNTVIEKRNEIAFNEALHKNDYTSFENFIEKYPNAKQVNEARALYEKHLYKTKTADSTWQSFKGFIDQYPKSPYFKEAQTKYERLMYLDKTRDHSLNSYLLFTQSYPNSPYFTEAEDSIYAIATRDDQLSSYIGFINQYSYNHNYNKAWEKIYQKETQLFSYKTFTRFLQKYPLYPDMAKLEKEMKLTSRQFESYKKNGLYGYVDVKSRDTVIKARFTEAAPFNEGMAVVKLPCDKKKCPYAYVNMSGRVIATYPWSDANDFTEGHALAAIGNCEKDSCKYGFINRFGNWIVKPLYDDVYEYSEGLAQVYDKKSGYGYIDKEGKVVIPLRYTGAGTFSEGMAAVQNGDSALYGFVDKNGNYIIHPSYKKAGAFREGLAPVADPNGMWGYIDHSGKWVIKPQYDFALPFIYGRAKVVIKEKDKKNPAIITMTDKVIDKKGKVLKQS